MLEVEKMLRTILEKLSKKTSEGNKKGREPEGVTVKFSFNYATRCFEQSCAKWKKELTFVYPIIRACGRF